MKYFAFISYNSHDQAWGRWLHQKLENYRMPATLCGKHGWERKPMKPVFFAPTDIQPGGLTAELQERLQVSRHLIVICSPHSAKSEWVGKEIEYFHSLGRTENIHFFIVDGTPHSGDPQTECFNPVVQRLGLPEILGANIHERIYRQPWLNRERAYVQLISKLLGTEYDSIWQRHRRLLVKRTVTWTVGVLAIIASLCIVWRTNQPVDVMIQLEERSETNEYLPPLKDAVVTLFLPNEIKIDTIRTLGSTVTFANIPHRYLNRPAHITVDVQDYLVVDTIVTLNRKPIIGIWRDLSVYGDIRVKLWNPIKDMTYPMAKVYIEDYVVESDVKGFINLSLPLNEQRQSYHITSSNPSINDFIIMPCGPDAIVLVTQ